MVTKYGEMSELKRSNKRILYLLFNPPPSARVRATIFEDIYKEKGYEVNYFNMYSICIQKMLGNKYLKTSLLSPKIKFVP